VEVTIAKDFRTTRSGEQMLRKVLLVLMAVALSYGMAAIGGYILYSISEGRSESHLEETYSLRDKAIQQQFPRLIAIHCGFLTCIFLGQTVLFAMKPRLPSYWFTPHGKQGDTLYGALIIVPAIVLTTQVFISRRILSRSVKRKSEISQTDMPSSMDKL
jgi:hypothetical protein